MQTLSMFVDGCIHHSGNANIHGEGEGILSFIVIRYTVQHVCILLGGVLKKFASKTQNK